jgi:hypothetical protein
VVEVFPKTVNRDDYPVGIATVTRLKRRFWLSSDGFLSERDNLFGEAG